MNADYFDLLRRLSQPIRAAALPHTLEHVQRLLDALGNPQQHYHAVVVTGSTGKGTTCLRLAADLFSFAGLKSGSLHQPAPAQLPRTLRHPKPYNRRNNPYHRRVIAVVSRAAPHGKIPEWEQVLSAGAAAMNLVTAAHALGYAANWITEWYAYDRAVLDALGLLPHERIAGFIHIGRPPGPPEDRPRPPLAEIATRFPAKWSVAAGWVEPLRNPSLIGNAV